MSELGKRLGDYVVEREIARGGQGVVLAARHHESERPVALKLLTRVADPALAKRFQQEARILAALEHPNVLRVYDLFSWQGLACMALERVEGPSLEALSERAGGRLDPLEACRLLLPLSDALAACHRKGVIHRDLKPANVLREDASGRPVLLDFGLAQRDRELLPDASLDRTRLSLTGEIKGTFRFMAPEQAQPGRLGSTGPATDVYGLGGLILALVGGSAPTTGEGPPVVILRRVVEEPAPDLWSLCPEAPAALAELCRRCLAKDPAARPGLAEVARGLAALLGRPAPAFALAEPLAEPPPAPGQELEPSDPRQVGPYRLERRLGQGGMGAVFLGRHRSLGALRAVKVTDAFGGETRAARFGREVEHLARIRHAQVVGVHEGGREGRLLWYAMDLVEGESLADALERGPLPVSRALAVAHGVAAGVAALHREGIVHRDLKPANVVLRPEGSPVVIDLGLALAPERDQRLTRTGALIGTPRYMSPDQLRGSAEPQVDVYALGLILFELLTGEVATGEAETPAELIGKILHEERPAPSSVDESLPASVDRLCARLLAQDPAQRPRDAGEVEQLLAALVGAPSLPRRRRAPLALIAVGLIVALGAALGLALAPGEGERRASSSPGPSRAAAGAAPDPGALAAASEELARRSRLQDPRERAGALASWLELYPAHPEREEARAAWVVAQRTFPLRTLLAGRQVQEVHLLPAGRFLVCSQFDALVLDAEGREERRWSGRSWARACLTPSQREAWISFKGARLVKVDLERGEELSSLETGLVQLEAFSLSADGGTLAFGGVLNESERRIGLLSTASGEQRPLARVEGKIRQLRFSGGRLMAGTGRNSEEAFNGTGANRAFDNYTRIYDLASGEEVLAIRAMASVDTLHVLPDGSFVAGTSIGELTRYSREGEVLQGFVSRGPDGRPEFGNGLLALALPGAVRGLTHLGQSLYAVEGEINLNRGSLSQWSLEGQRLRLVTTTTAYRDVVTDGERLYLASSRGLEVWLP